MADVVTNPQLAVPFSIGPNGAPDIVEQDSDSDIYQNAIAVLYYEIGERTAIPDYGIPDQALRENGANWNELAAAIRKWEPNATPELISRAIEDATSTLEISLTAPATGEQ
jgi:hypothetical protein